MLEELMKFRPVKDYINDTLSLRSSAEAVQEFLTEINKLSTKTLTDAKKISLKDKRKTIMLQHIQESMDKNLRRKDLPWQDIAQELIKQTPADLGKISKKLNQFLKKNK